MEQKNQTFNNNWKEQYGDIQTDYKLINIMLDMFPSEIFSNKNNKLLDPCCCYEYFHDKLYEKLFTNIKEIDDKDKHNHIIEKMLYFKEINTYYEDKVKIKFGEYINYEKVDFLSLTEKKDFYEIILGNPPYNSNGLKKVPTNKTREKEKDGNTIYNDFIRKSISMLKQEGYLCFITPCIWLKEDKSGMYNYLLQNDNIQIEKMRCMNNTETNKYFRGEAQTPTVMFLLKKSINTQKLYIYDKMTQKYEYFELLKNYPVPTFASTIVNHMLQYVKKYGSLYDYVIKTSMPTKKALIIDKYSEECKYINIKTCQIYFDNNPQLIFNYSNIPLAYSNEEKIVLAHKMYGFAYYDVKGSYGISNRDNYVILKQEGIELSKLFSFLSSYFVIFLLETCKYRMKCLEKHVFHYIPNICNMESFSDKIGDDEDEIYKIFGLLDRKDYINNYFKKKYKLYGKNNTTIVSRNLENNKIDNKIER